MEGRKIVIACQGDGSHTAFTAGVLKKLLSEGIHQAYNLVGLSGTSGGGIVALLAWYGIVKTAQGDTNLPYQWLEDFWHDNSAYLPWEKSLNALIIQSMRWQDHGILPSVTNNPYAAEWILNWLKAVSPRDEFLDLQALLKKHIDFAEINYLIERNSPRLLLGAVDIQTGELKTFDSQKREVELKTVLACVAIPNLLKAVEIGGISYWDALFSSNPPINQFLMVPVENRPDEVWIVQVGSTSRRQTPITTGDILDRRNEIAGNFALKREVELIELVNEWIEKGNFDTGFRESVKPIKIRWIAINPKISEKLDYASKLNRDVSFIQMLMNEGEQQAANFLATNT